MAYQKEPDDPDQSPKVAASKGGAAFNPPKPLPHPVESLFARGGIRHQLGAGIPKNRSLAPQQEE